jgi:hypothetical protein
MNELTKREQIALQIMNGACAGDWKFDVPTGMKWDAVAALRSFEIADAFLDVAEGRIVLQKDPIETVPEEKIKPIKKATKK